jgi:hypothetical protein
MLELLQTLDESIFTPELKDSLSEKFNEAVNAKVEEKLQEALEGKLEEAKKEVEIELSSRLDEYLDQVINEWAEQNSLVMESEVKTAKLEALIEGFEAMLIAGGIEAIRIQEAKDEMDDEDEDEMDDEESTKKSKEAKKEDDLEENDGNDDESEEDDAEYNESSKDLIDRLMKENLELKKEKDELIIMGFVLEESASMTELQKEKFIKLSESLNSSDKEKFLEDLLVIKNTILESQEEKPEEETIQESKKYVSKASHLIR